MPALTAEEILVESLKRQGIEVLVTQKNLRGLRQLNATWVEGAMAQTKHQRILLDMDSSESPVYGEQEGAAYNGHFGRVCYHPLFCFNQFGDCQGAMLRPGNIHYELAQEDRILACDVGKHWRFFVKGQIYEWLVTNGSGRG